MTPAPERPITLDMLEDTLRRVLMGTGLVPTDAVEDAAVILAGRVWQNLPAAAPVTDAGLPCGYCNRDYPHRHDAAILIGPDEHPNPVTDAGLDVDRLARALHEIGGEFDDPFDPDHPLGMHNSQAAAIAAEYAALSRQAEKETA